MNIENEGVKFNPGEIQPQIVVPERCRHCSVLEEIILYKQLAKDPKQAWEVASKRRFIIEGDTPDMIQHHFLATAETIERNRCQDPRYCKANYD